MTPIRRGAPHRVIPQRGPHGAHLRNVSLMKVQATQGNFFVNQILDKKATKKILSWFLDQYGPTRTSQFLEELKSLGFHAATQAGLSLGFDDLAIPTKKKTLLLDAEENLQDCEQIFHQGRITAVERYQRVITLWATASENLKDEVVENFQRTDLFNPLYMMAFSGARGNISQVRQLVGMRGLMADSAGGIIDFPIRRNFREGLSVTEYIISCYGARKGLIDTALRTADSGYLTRRLVDVAHGIMIGRVECGTQEGFHIFPLKTTEKSGTESTLLSLEKRIQGRLLAQNVVQVSLGEMSRQSTLGTELRLLKVKYVAEKNDQITPHRASEIVQAVLRQSHDDLQESFKDFFQMSDVSYPDVCDNDQKMNEIQVLTPEGVLEKIFVEHIFSKYKALSGTPTLPTTLATTPATEHENLRFSGPRSSNLPSNSLNVSVVSNSRQTGSPLIRLSKTIKTSNQPESLYIRSPLTCQHFSSAREDICQLCYGWSLAQNRLVSLGEAVGVLAAQSIGEPGTQLTMRTFHTGGIFSTDIEAKIFAPHDGIVSFSGSSSQSNPESSPGKTTNLQLGMGSAMSPLIGKKIRTSYGETAFFLFAPIQLKLQKILSESLTEISIFSLPAQSLVFVYPGQHVKKNTCCAEISHLQNVDTKENENDFIIPALRGLPTVKSANTEEENLQEQKTLNEEPALEDLSDNLLQNSQNKQNSSETKKVLSEIEGQIYLREFVEGLSNFSIREESSPTSLQMQKGINSLWVLNGKPAAVHPRVRCSDFFSAKSRKESKTAQKISRKLNKFPLSQNIFRFDADVHQESTPASFLLSRLDSTQTKKSVLCQLNSVNWIQTKKIGKERVSQNRFDVLWGKNQLFDSPMFFSDGVINRDVSETLRQKLTHRENLLRKDQGTIFTALKNLSTNSTRNSTSDQKQQKDFEEQLIEEQTSYGGFESSNRREAFRTHFGLFVSQNRLRPLYHTWRKSETITANVSLGGLDTGGLDTGGLDGEFKNNLKIFSPASHHTVDCIWENTYLSVSSDRLSMKSDQKRVRQSMIGEVRRGTSLVKNSNKKSDDTGEVSQSYREVESPVQALLLQKAHCRTLQILRSQTTENKISRNRIGEPVWTRRPLGKSQHPLTGLSFDSEKSMSCNKSVQILKISSGRSAKNKTLGLTNQISQNPGSCELTLRRVHPYLISKQATLGVEHGDVIQSREFLFELFFEKSKTGDIVQGLPKIEQLFEARRTSLHVQESIHKKLRQKYFESSKNFPCLEATRQSIRFIQRVLIDEIQNVYQSQGVDIADKHIEIIVRQMTSKVIIREKGKTSFFPGDIIDFYHLDSQPRSLYGVEQQVEQPENKNLPVFEPLVLGITKIAFMTESFVSAASFQEAKRVLMNCALESRVDFLYGLKENVIVGRFIRAGTGFRTAVFPTNSNHSSLS